MNKMRFLRVCVCVDTERGGRKRSEWDKEQRNEFYEQATSLHVQKNNTQETFSQYLCTLKTFFEKWCLFVVFAGEFKLLICATTICIRYLLIKLDKIFLQKSNILKSWEANKILLAIHKVINYDQSY